MPWMIVKVQPGSSTCPSNKPYAVLNKDTGRKMGCHPSMQAARDQVKALYVNVPESKSSKSS